MQLSVLRSGPNLCCQKASVIVPVNDCSSRWAFLYCQEKAKNRVLKIHKQNEF